MFSGFRAPSASGSLSLLQGFLSAGVSNTGSILSKFSVDLPLLKLAEVTSMSDDPPNDSFLSSVRR